jgi:hypothetical protein
MESEMEIKGSGSQPSGKASADYFTGTGAAVSPGKLDQEGRLWPSSVRPRE